MSEVSAFLSARAAAELAGVDERTIRRWVKTGQLAADKRGGRFRIAHSDLAPFIGQGGHSNGHERTDAADRTERTADAVLVNVELVRLVDRLQRENRELAGQLGYVQAKLQEAQLALAAPKEPISQERPFFRDSEGVAVEPPQTPPEARNGRPWWKFWAD